MPWVIGVERLNRSYAYHYHKKAARRAVYENSGDNNKKKKQQQETNHHHHHQNPAVSSLVPQQQQQQLQLVFRVVPSILHVVYQRQVIQSTMRRMTGRLGCLAGDGFNNDDDDDAYNYRARLMLHIETTATTTTNTNSNDENDKDDTVRRITGQGVEICTDKDNNDDDNTENNPNVPLLWRKHKEESFTITTGCLSLVTGRFYWIEERWRREKHLVMGTLQPNYWSNVISSSSSSSSDKNNEMQKQQQQQQQQQTTTTFVSEDALYVKRRDVDRCGIPLDGDIRETILSLTTVDGPNGDKYESQETNTKIEPENNDTPTRDSMDDPNDSDVDPPACGATQANLLVNNEEEEGSIVSVEDNTSAINEDTQPAWPDQSPLLDGSNNTNNSNSSTKLLLLPDGQDDLIVDIADFANPVGSDNEDDEVEKRILCASDKIPQDYSLSSNVDIDMVLHTLVDENTNHVESSSTCTSPVDGEPPMTSVSPEAVVVTPDNVLKSDHHQHQQQEQQAQYSSKTTEDKVILGPIHDPFQDPFEEENTLESSCCLVDAATTIHNRSEKVKDIFGNDMEPSTEREAQEEHVPSLVPSIQEARGLIDQVLSRSSTHQRSDPNSSRVDVPATDMATTTTLVQPVEADDLNHPFDFSIDESAFEEQDGDIMTTTPDSRGEFGHKHDIRKVQLNVIEEWTSGGSQSDDDDDEMDENDMEVKPTALFGPSAVVREKQELHTEIERLNQQFELLSSYHPTFKLGKIEH